MADYTHYGSQIASEWLEFAKTLQRPELPEDLEMAKKISNERRATQLATALGPVKGLRSENISIPVRDGHSVPGRLYFPDSMQPSTIGAPLYIYLHGGGYHFGSVDTEDIYCRLIAVGVPCIVLNVEYRHTPRWTFPTQFNDVFDAIDWITDPERVEKYGLDQSKVVIGGVSSGATIALAAVQREIEEGTKRLRGCNVACPTTVRRTQFPRHLIKDGYTSFEQHENAPQLTVARHDWFRKLLNDDPESLYGSALLLPNKVLEQFPRGAFQVCGADPLRDGALLLEDKLKSLDVETRLHVYTGMPHCFWNSPELPSSAEYRQRLVDFARWALLG